jgi:hypothetical protein
LAAFSASVSVAAGAEATGAFMFDVGGSSGPLRPQAPSASAAALKSTTAHPDVAGRNLLITSISPNRAAPYKDCLVERI